MAADINKVVRIQADRLAKEIGLEKGTFFEISELELISNAAYGEEVEIRGLKFTSNASRKALADIIIRKIRLMSK